MDAKSEEESMLGQEMRDPAANTSLYRRYGLPALVVLGLVAVAGLAGHPWHSPAAGLRGTKDSPEHIIGLAEKDPQDDAADAAADAEEEEEDLDKALEDAVVPSDQIETIKRSVDCVEIGDVCRTACLATGTKCREFWKAEDYDWTTYTTDSKKCQDDEQSCGTKCNSEEEECAKAGDDDDDDADDGEVDEEEPKEGDEDSGDASETAADKDAEKEIEAVSEAVEGAEGLDDGEVKTVEETVKCDEVGEACRQTCLDTAKTCGEFWKVDDYDWSNWSMDSKKCTDAEQSCGGKCNSDEETCLNGVSQ